MALYAFDGTGNEDRPGTDRDSNVLHFFNAYQDPPMPGAAARRSLYIEGIGVRAHTPIGDVLAKTFGLAARQRLREARQRLARNLADGDATVDIVGFSRGAALAVDFANHVCKEVEAANVRFVGVWDIVAQFGLPGEHVNLGFDLDCPDVVAYHAMAIDENRALFPLTRMLRDDKPVDGFVEAWFRGVHSDVGGGNGNRGLNWISLHWMLKAAQREHLPILQSEIDRNLADRARPQQIRIHTVAAGVRRHIFDTDLLHASVQPISGRADGPEMLLPRIDDDGIVRQVQA